MTRAPSQKPRVIPPPSALRMLGPLVVVDGECPYFRDGRPNRTAFALPGIQLEPAEYETAMGLGMRRSGSLVYRPICPSCRRCQPFRIDVERFEPSRSQRRVLKRCNDLFTVERQRPVVDQERLELYARYQEGQHGFDGQTTDEDSYERFLIDTIADSWELSWRDARGELVAVGIIDAVPDGISTVYFYWDPALRDLSLGVFSALYEIDLCRQWGKRYYYLGYLVAGAKTMSYKASFKGGEVWDGASWVPVPGRDLEDAAIAATLEEAECKSMAADDLNFRLD